MAKQNKSKKQDKYYLQPEPIYDPVEAGNQVLDPKKGPSPEVKDEEKETDPEPKDISREAGEMGIKTGDPQHPQELNLAKDLDEAEKHHRES